MFDVGFWELVVVFVLGLLVLGPDRLPRVARTVGQWIAQAKSVANRFQREIEREIAMQDLQARYEHERVKNPPPPPPAGSEAGPAPAERGYEPDQDGRNGHRGRGQPRGPPGGGVGGLGHAVWRRTCYLYALLDNGPDVQVGPQLNPKPCDL